MNGWKKNHEKERRYDRNEEKAIDRDEINTENGIAGWGYNKSESICFYHIKVASVSSI